MDTYGHDAGDRLLRGVADLFGRNQRAEDFLARAGDTPAAVYERADRALYEAKAAGRNRCVAASARATA